MPTPFHYEPIRCYQTRLIQLHGDGGNANSALLCTLNIADFVDPAVGRGLGIRARNGEQDCLMFYEALSYTWGGEDKSRKIICNGQPLYVTDNLYNALRALRLSGDSRRYIWVDAICIDQEDEEERAIQVRNMFVIYRNALRVVAWLGLDHANTAMVLVSDTDGFPTWDANKAYTELERIYTLPFFRRIWIQQEIFAARTLIFQCGPHQFEWSALESCHWTSARHCDIDSDRMTRLQELRDSHTGCFQHFRRAESSQLDLVGTLLKTSVLEATDPRDYIYGVLGMTKFSACPMSIQEWTVGRETDPDVFIPIDYSADLSSVFSTVTWALLMLKGLAFLVSIKPRYARTPNMEHGEFPSWVVDWRIAARTLVRLPNWQLKEYPKYSDARHNATSQNDRKTHIDLFRDDNMLSTYPCTKLIIRGTIDPRFRIEDNYVCLTRNLRRDKRLWHIPTTALPTDLVVYVPAFSNPYVSDIPRLGQSTQGPWVLRPTANDEFRLVACLTNGNETLLPYPQYTAYGSFTDAERDDYALIPAQAVEPGFLYKAPAHDRKLEDLRQFIIV